MTTRQADSSGLALGSRAAFPTLDATAYLAHCSISPLATPVVDALTAVADDHARLGAGAFVRWMEDRRALRAELAELVGASPDDVAFMPGTTSALIACAQSIRWRPGDRVVIFDGEFPANVTPWQQAAARFELDLVWGRAEAFRGASGDGLSALEAALQRGGVRVVAVSAVQFQTGLAMPVGAMGALCERYGALLVVDAIQALGAQPIDMDALGIDVLAGGAHKWLMGVMGAGFLIARPRAREQMGPALAGWLSHPDAVDFLSGPTGTLRYDKPVRTTLDWLEAGTPAVGPLAALRASLGMLRAVGVDAIVGHIHGYLASLERRLLALGLESVWSTVPEQRAGILGIRPPVGVTATALSVGLADHGIVTTAPEGILRFAPHWCNPMTEVDAVASAVEAVTEACRAS